jgi:predicted GIY-YIG superfamily endonuclease
MSQQPKKAALKAYFFCYLLRSLKPGHPNSTYIGFTVHPKRRIRQHNGEIKAGAYRVSEQCMLVYIILQAMRVCLACAAAVLFYHNKHILHERFAWTNCSILQCVVHHKNLAALVAAAADSYATLDYRLYIRQG